MLRAVEFDEKPYSILSTPFWLDELVACIKDVATYRLRLQVYRARVSRMEGAVRRVSQRVNLFEKVLIPNARRDIARIKIFLSDIERAAVVIVIGILQGECCAAAINASKGKPAIFGLSVTPAAIVEGFAVFAFVFALIVSGAIPKG